MGCGTPFGAEFGAGFAGTTTAVGGTAGDEAGPEAEPELDVLCCWWASLWSRAFSAMALVRRGNW